MSKPGYIHLHRKIQDNFLWKERRVFSRAEAWIDILMEVRWQDFPEEVTIGNKTMTCNQGEILYSLETWAGRWRWSKAKVKRFLECLHERNAIETRSETQTTRIKVCNYSEYQNVRNANETITDTQTSHRIRSKAVKQIQEEPPLPPIPEFIDPEIWRDFIRHRAEIKKPMTEAAQKRMLKRLEEFKAKGFNPNEAMSRSIINRWQDVYEPKNNGSSGRNSPTTETTTPDEFYPYGRI